MGDVTRRAIEFAKRAAVVEGAGGLAARHFIIAVLADTTLREAVSSLLLDDGAVAVPRELEAVVTATGAASPVERKIPLAPGFKEGFQNLYREFGGLPPLSHLLKWLVQQDDEVVRSFLAANPKAIEAGGDLPAAPSSNLGRLMEDVNALQNMLAQRVIGQRQAVQQIADALFQAKIYGRSSDDAPRAVLLFLGPPGVGKTYTAQLMAESLCSGGTGDFLRLDMSGYADRDSYRMLVGFEPSYQGARPGLLTEFVAQHPESLILVDEVEKANPVVHNLFLQILDRGVLEDKHTRENVSFGETTIVFTTNLGRELYASPNQSGFLSQFPISRPAVLEALVEARNPLTGQPALTPELVSRLAKGYPILFNHLTPVDLEEIARLSIGELALEFEAQLGIRLVPPDDRLLTLMVLRLGPDLDARSLTAGIPLMIKDAFRDVLTEHRHQLFEEAGTFDRVRTLALRLPDGPEREFFEDLHQGGERVVMVTDAPHDRVCPDLFPAFQWRFAPGGDEAVEMLRAEGADLVLLDLDLHISQGMQRGTGALRALRKIRTSHPDLPVYLYSDRDLTVDTEPDFSQRIVDSGGARGFLAGPIERWAAGEGSPLEDVRRILLRERHLREMFRTRQNVQFHWEIDIEFEDKEGTIVLRPRDIHTQTVVASRDRTARLTFTGIPGERFGDVAGAREAKRRLGEVIRWMRAPELLGTLGVDLPKGILLEGPPGNGKTLLARATAGEAGLPFFAVSATDFASKWVGESEANIRELFERAATYAPSILFIDEIDAIGARRSGEHAGIHDSMLNQLLVSMDGFSSKDRPVFFLAATNRADMLDPALKRPGRFDLIITVDDLDVEARHELLRIKTASLPLAEDVDLKALARGAMGLSGAQLAQMVKEAAILALREAEDSAGEQGVHVSMRVFREALTNVRYGLKREGPLPSEGEMERTAYHEAGHALVAELERPGSVHQATVLPRGRALGFVESLPESEYASITIGDIRSRIRVALAGRGAELAVYGDDGVSAGCSQDLEVATRIATLAVSRYGMSREIGPLSLPVVEQLLPRARSSEGALAEIHAMLKLEEATVSRLLEAHRPALDMVARLLLERETVTGREISSAIRGHTPPHTGGGDAVALTE